MDDADDMAPTRTETPLTTGDRPGGGGADAEPPRLARGVELLGEYEGSGFKQAPYMARLGSGQMVQLSPLLHLVADAVDGRKDYEQLAADVTESFGRGVSAENIQVIVEEKLRPLGLLTLDGGAEPIVQKPDPLLALRFRVKVISERYSQRVASLFKPLFRLPIVLTALAAMVAVDIWLFTEHGLAQAFRDAIYNPALILLVLGLVLLSAAWHEFGHAAGCAYGGATPGAMGAGIYVAYPAFYTDVTDSYRLGRGGRLRTDLAGIYFNGLFILVVAGLYAVTGFEPLLLVVLVQHLEVAHQLLPFLRLDGYYIVADLTGVPDMFARIRPILLSLVPWRKADSVVSELKPWARAVVTVWVLLVVPLLGFQLVMIALHLPRIGATVWDSLGRQAHTMSSELDGGNALAALAAAVQIPILALPVVGVSLTLALVGWRAARGGWRATEEVPGVRAAFTVAYVGLLVGLVWTWLPNGEYDPIRRGERGTVNEAVASTRKAGGGTPSLEPQIRAAQRGELRVGSEELDRTPAVSTTTTATAEEATSDETDPAGDDGEGTSATTDPTEGSTSTTEGEGTTSTTDSGGQSTTTTTTTPA